MDIRDITGLVRFQEGLRPVHETLLETDNLWSEIICLESNQETGTVGDPGADAIFTTLAGEVVIWMNRSSRRLKQWHSVVAPAGTEVTLKSASKDPSVVLVVVSPPPAS
jgi:hypothetical protein